MKIFKDLSRSCKVFHQGSTVESMYNFYKHFNCLNFETLLRHKMMKARVQSWPLGTGNQ